MKSSLVHTYVCRSDLIIRRYNAPGILIVTNTIEKFKTTDKEQLLKETSALVRPSLYVALCYLSVQIWKDICSGAAITDPSLLNRFHLFTYAVSETV